jgi:hypothetical protein
MTGGHDRACFRTSLNCRSDLLFAWLTYFLHDRLLMGVIYKCILIE